VPLDDLPDATTLRRRRAVGDRLRSLRHLRNLAQDALADRAGLHRSTLQRVEYGKSAVSLDLLWAISDALGVPVTWLLSDEWRALPSGGAEGGEWPDDPLAR
jgi:transcriptional regulator with XRE-family HTH domain